MALGSIDTVLNYSSGEAGGVDVQHMGIGVGFTQGALTVGANYGERERGTASTDGFGLAVNYSLGGGATFQIGYSSDSGDGLVTPAGDDTMSMGLALSF
jgi:outer membrane protein OmpU